MDNPSNNVVSLADLASLENRKSPVYVEVTCNSKKYLCEIEKNPDKLIISTKIAPKGYHIEGVLFSGYDETKKGLEVRGVLADKNLSPTYYRDGIEYARGVSVRATDLRQEVIRFVEDVHTASVSVDNMILQYISSIPRKLGPRFDKYRKAI